MELPDFMSYSNKFTNGEFLEKISKIAKRAGAKLVYIALVLYYTLQSDKVALKDKAIIVGALGYLVSPLDVIPTLFLSLVSATTWLCCSMLLAR